MTAPGLVAIVVAERGRTLLEKWRLPDPSFIRQGMACRRIVRIFYPSAVGRIGERRGNPCRTTIPI